MNGVNLFYAAIGLFCFVDTSLASSCPGPSFTMIRDYCYTCVNKSSDWSQIHSVCDSVSTEVANIPSDYLLILTVNMCSGVATSHVWVMYQPSREGNLTEKNNVTDERMSTNSTNRMSTNSTNNYCSALRLHVARIEHRPCYIQYPVLCQTRRTERMEKLRFLMKRKVNKTSIKSPFSVNEIIAKVDVAVTTTAASTEAQKTNNSFFANPSCDPYKPNCTFTCPWKRFGFNCTSYCSLKCEKQVCHSLTGVCTDGCVQGRSGLKCQIDCPNHCAENLCDQKTSICTKGCQMSFTGQRCLMQCYNCAGNRSCDQFSGICHAGCAEGFAGTTCSKGVVRMTKDPWVLIIVSIVGGSSLFLMLMVAGIRYRVCKALLGISQGSAGRNENVPET